MSRSPRVRGKNLLCLGLVVVASAWTGACRKLLGGSERTSMGDVEANLDQLIAVTKDGLDLQVSPRFLTFGPVPGNAPWDAPVAASRSVDVHGHAIALKAGKDGMVRERYEARACPLREIWSCVELWATGRFGKNGEIGCVGLRLEKGSTIEKRKLDLRSAENCPAMTTAPGPAQQVIRGIEKAQLDHTQRQETDRFLDPKAQ